MTGPARPAVVAPLEEAVAALNAGDAQGAATRLLEMATRSPADPEPRYWLFAALQNLGDDDGAKQALIDARTLHAVAVMRQVGVDLVKMQADKAYAVEIGHHLYAKGLMAAASVAFGRGLDFETPDLRLMVSYGLSLQHQGRIDEAVDVFNAAGDLFAHPEVHGYQLYAMFHVTDRGSRLKAAAEAWARLYADPLTPANPSFPNPRTTDRPLKIGYIGPSFTKNQVAQFIGPVLKAHNASAVEVFLYSAEADSESDLPDTAKRRPIAQLSDEAVAELVRCDEIDILVDLWGHTAGSRLCVFARRPAPVQIAWVNFVQTTGLSAIDYVMHADSMDAPGTAQMFVEQVWRMGEIMVPFRPLPGRPDVQPTPALRNGYVTFGSFNNPAKLSDATIAAWAAILRARAADRLVLKYSLFSDPVLRRTTQARFAAHGVAADRIEFRGETKGAAYLAEFQDIDLALDPSPSPGGTTSCDAVSNGVPLLTLKGEDFYARIGLPLLLPCGLPELVAENWDDYVEKALSLTEDLAALDALRQQIRPAFEASAYRDEAGFTRGLEAQYKQMFQLWLDKSEA